MGSNGQEQRNESVKQTHYNQKKVKLDKIYPNSIKKGLTGTKSLEKTVLVYITMNTLQGI